VKALVDSKKTLLHATPQLLQKAAYDSAGIKLTVKNEDIVSCANPRKLVETYKVIGGPSRGEVERSIIARKKTMNQTNAAVQRIQDQLVVASKKIDQIIHDYSLSTAPKTQHLKI
jgi:hypothetical protein